MLKVITNLIILFIVLLFIWGIIENSRKYEGLTAEEWFYEYDWAVECVGKYGEMGKSAQYAYDNCF